MEYGKGRLSRPLRERGLHRSFLHAGRLRFAYPSVDGSVESKVAQDVEHSSSSSSSSASAGDACADALDGADSSSNARCGAQSVTDASGVEPGRAQGKVADVVVAAPLTHELVALLAACGAATDGIGSAQWWAVHSG